MNTSDPVFEHWMCTITLTLTNINPNSNLNYMYIEMKFKTFFVQPKIKFNPNLNKTQVTS